MLEHEDFSFANKTKILIIGDKLEKITGLSLISHSNDNLSNIIISGKNLREISDEVIYKLINIGSIMIWVVRNSCRSSQVQELEKSLIVEYVDSIEDALSIIHGTESRRAKLELILNELPEYTKAFETYSIRVLQEIYKIRMMKKRLTENIENGTFRTTVKLDTSKFSDRFNEYIDRSEVAELIMQDSWKFLDGVLQDAVIRNVNLITSLTKPYSRQEPIEDIWAANSCILDKRSGLGTYIIWERTKSGELSEYLVIIKDKKVVYISDAVNKVVNQILTIKLPLDNNTLDICNYMHRGWSVTYDTKDNQGANISQFTSVKKRSIFGEKLLIKDRNFIEKEIKSIHIVWDITRDTGLGIKHVKQVLAVDPLTCKGIWINSGYFESYEIESYTVAEIRDLVDIPEVVKLFGGSSND